MGRNRGGYTIIEVMIVIAITALLFASAVITFRGEQGRTGFSQSMQDLASSIQNYASKISSGTYPGSDGLQCDASSGQPRISNNNGTVASNQCIFLGRVFMIQPTGSSSDTISSYVIVGTRDIFAGGFDSGTLISSLDQAQPNLAEYSGTTNPVLQENFSLTNGSQITKSSVSPAAGSRDYDMIGLFNNLQTTTGGTSNANNLLLVPYDCDNSGGGSPCTAPSAISSLISSTPLNNSSSIDKWYLCVKGGGGEKAQLEVDSSAAGTSNLGVKVNFDSINCP